MTAFVLLSLPIFGIVALGWAPPRTRVATPGALDALGAFSDAPLKIGEHLSASRPALRRRKRKNGRRAATLHGRRHQTSAAAHLAGVRP
jgi:hypothetical protein